MRGGRLRLAAGSVVFALVAAMLPAMGSVCAASSGTDPASYISPVDAEISRHFEQPLGPYSAGHRGVDFDVPEGTSVSASNSGTVTFAGPVAADGFFITIRHAFDLSTTYSFLSAVFVKAGQRVERGDAIGSSGPGHPGEDPGLHFGMKVGDVYIDPELVLLGGLKDISDLISLKAFPDTGSADEPIQHPGSPALRSPGSITAHPRGPSSGIFIKVGKGIADVGANVAKAPKGLGHLLSGLGNGIGGALSLGIHRLGVFGQVVGAGARRVGQDVAHSPKVRSVISVFRSGIHLVKTVWTALNEESRPKSETRRVLHRGVRDIGAFLSGPWVRALMTKLHRSITLPARASTNTVKFLASFVFGMTKGAIEQVGCDIKGGWVPPKIPSEAEFQHGAKVPPAPNDHIVVAVAGIGTSTRFVQGSAKTDASMYTMDLRTLGYRDDQIFHYSYKGIEDRKSGAVARGPYRIHAAYSQEDTYKSIADSAFLLSQQIELIHKRNPDSQIDLVAHSQGGLVAEYYLENFYQPHIASQPVIGHYVTMSTPHLGADGASAADILDRSRAGDSVLRKLDSYASHGSIPPPSAKSAMQMAEASSFLKNLNGGWEPERINATTIGTAFDYVVTPQHTRLAGARHYTVRLSLHGDLSAHGAVVSAPTTKGILYGALANRPAPCTALRDALAEHGTGALISSFEDSALRALELNANLVNPRGN